MKRMIRTALVAVLFALPIAGALAGCERREGPAEELGEGIDDAADEATDRD